MREHRFDTFDVAPRIQGIEFNAVLARSHRLKTYDTRTLKKAPDSDWIIAQMNELGVMICVAQHPRRPAPLPINPEIYKSHHLIENFFSKLEEFKRLAMRAGIAAISFKAMIYAIAALINS